MIYFYSGATPDNSYSLYPDAAPAFRLFCHCRPQYETIVTMAGGSRHYQGICRNELASVMNMSGIKRKQQAQLLHQVLLVEKGAREGSREG